MTLLEKIRVFFTNAAQCPFCLRTIAADEDEYTLRECLASHIRSYHFPAPVYHCTHCLRIMTAHEKTPSSPPMWIPCEGGEFIQTNRAAEGYPQ